MRNFEQRLDVILEIGLAKNVAAPNWVAYARYLKTHAARLAGKPGQPPDPKLERVINDFVARANAGYDHHNLEWDRMLKSLPGPLHEFAVYGWTAHIDPTAGNQAPGEKQELLPDRQVTYNNTLQNR